jgi:hypothetical protein
MSTHVAAQEAKMLSGQVSNRIQSLLYLLVKLVLLVVVVATVEVDE